jgi:uncharacterized membrane-anchored protein YjiN (DUF445 family)
MQWLATLLLCAMLALLIASTALQSAYPWLHWVRAFAEAGTVGAFADLFAVVALFRHPLGLPIPHTAIIPSNKDRIADNLGRFAVSQFFTRENVRRQLESSGLTIRLAQWLADPATRRTASQFMVHKVPAVLKAIEDEAGERLLHEVGRRLATIEISSIAGGLVFLLTRDNRHQAILDRALQALEQWLIANDGVVKAKFSQASAYTPGFFDNYIVERLVEGMVALLRDVAVNPDHEIRSGFHRLTVDLIDQLNTSGTSRRRGQEIFGEVIDDLATSGTLLMAWRAIKAHILVRLDSDPKAVEQACESALACLSDGFLKKPSVQRALDPWLIEALEELVLSQRHRLAGLVTSAVGSWSPQEVARKVEIEIGRDLQYIRINGTLVGGAIGLILHAVTAGVLG